MDNSSEQRTSKEQVSGRTVTVWETPSTPCPPRELKTYTFDELRETFDSEGIIPCLLNEVESLRGQLEAAEQHVKILQEQRAAPEPPAPASKKCVIEVFKRDDPAHPWGLRLIREHGEPWELCYSPEPIEVRHAHEPAVSLSHARLTWAMSCPCKCQACAELDDVLRAAQPPPAEQPFAIGDKIEWRGHYGEINDIGIVHVKFPKSGNAHFLHAKDLRRST
jgi:hypothetical protein